MKGCNHMDYLKLGEKILTTIDTDGIETVVSIAGGKTIVVASNEVNELEQQLKDLIEDYRL
jgi:hypothetical protein